MYRERTIQWNTNPLLPVQMVCTTLHFVTVTLSRCHAGGGERLASCGAMDGLYCEIVG